MPDQINNEGVENGEKRYTIDCNRDPTFFSRWTTPSPPPDDRVHIFEHKKLGNVELVLKGGKLYLNGHLLSLVPTMPDHLAKYGKPQIDQYLSYEFANAAMDKSDLNGNLLDFFLEHPEMIPKSWRREIRHILFPGTRLCYKRRRGTTYEEIHEVGSLAITSDHTSAWRVTVWTSNPDPLWKQGGKIDYPCVIRVAKRKSLKA